MTTPEQIAREAAEKISVALYSAGSPSHIIPISEPIIFDAIRRTVRDTGAVEALDDCQNMLWHAIEAEAYAGKPLQGAMRHSRLEANAALAKLKAIAGEDKP